MQKYASTQTMKWIEAEYTGGKAVLPMPFGVKKTDELILKLAELFDKPVPEQLKKERALAVDAMTDAHQYLHGKKFAVFGDPDYVIGIVSFLLEMGARPWHVLISRATKKIKKELDAHGKWAARDAGIPLFRIGFPIIDRVNLHRSPVVGYQGAINMLTMIANKFLDIQDETCEDQWFEMMR